MRPVPIEDGDLAEGYERHMFDGDGEVDLTADVRAVEALVGQDENGPRIAIKVAVDHRDLRNLSQHRHFWIVIHDDVLPTFSLEWPVAT